MQEARASVLIVEDEPKLAQLLVDYLSASGFASRVLDNGLDVVPAVRAVEPDLILLDLMLPGKDGVEEMDRLLGLELGDA